MSPDDLPSPWVDLLRQAEGRPEGILSLTGTDAEPEAELIAERLADLGFFRVVTAKRYQLTDTGSAALARTPGSKRRDTTGKSGWLGRLLSRK